MQFDDWIQPGPGSADFSHKGIWDVGRERKVIERQSKVVRKGKRERGRGSEKAKGEEWE